MFETAKKETNVAIWEVKLFESDDIFAMKIDSSALSENFKAIIQHEKEKTIVSFRRNKFLQRFRKFHLHLGSEELMADLFTSVRYISICLCTEHTSLPCSDFK